MTEISQKSIVGTLWEKKKDATPSLPPRIAEMKDKVFRLRRDTPLCITLFGLDTSEFYYLGRFEFFSNFTLLGECPKEGFKTSIGTMLIK